MNRYCVLVDSEITDGQRFVVVDSHDMRAVCRGCLYEDAAKIAEALGLYDRKHPPEALA